MGSNFIPKLFYFYTYRPDEKVFCMEEERSRFVLAARKVRLEQCMAEVIFTAVANVQRRKYNAVWDNDERRKT